MKVDRVGKTITWQPSPEPAQGDADYENPRDEYGNEITGPYKHVVKIRGDGNNIWANDDTDWYVVVNQYNPVKMNVRITEFELM